MCVYVYAVLHNAVGVEINMPVNSTLGYSLLIASIVYLLSDPRIPRKMCMIVYVVEWVPKLQHWTIILGPQTPPIRCTLFPSQTSLCGVVFLTVLRYNGTIIYAALASSLATGTMNIFTHNQTIIRVTKKK